MYFEKGFKLTNWAYFLLNSLDPSGISIKPVFYCSFFQFRNSKSYLGLLLDVLKILKYQVLSYIFHFLQYIITQNGFCSYVSQSLICQYCCHVLIF